MLEQKLKELIAAMDQPTAKANKLRLAAQVMEVAALVNEAPEIDPALFGLFDSECRKGAMSVVLAIFAQTLDA